MPKRIRIITADITTMKVEAIVNAANETLLGGKGVDGAIHTAAGPDMLKECRALKGCATGDAKVTAGYDLYAKYVIHTVGPIWKGGGAGESDLLRSCYDSCFKRAMKLGIRSIAFPAISTGSYGYPIEKSARISIEEVIGFLRKHDYMDEIYLVCYTDEQTKIYQQVFDEFIAGKVEKIFKGDQLSQLISQLDFLDDLNSIDFSDINLIKIDQILTEGPAAKYLPHPNDSYKDDLPPKNENGDLVYSIDGKEFTVPSVYVPLVEFAFHRFGGDPGIVALPDSNVFELIWTYIQQVVNWAFSLEKSLYGQVYDLLKEVDEYYKEMIIEINKLEANHANSPLYHELEKLPDIYQYCGKVLTSPGVDPRYKAEICLGFIYLISPIDFVPEGIINHPIAFSDDMAIMLLIMKRGIQKGFVNPKMIQRFWNGDENFIENLPLHYKRMEDHLGSEFIEAVWTYLLGKLEN